ncbi:zinc-ribbon domain containing protein [Candidatus Uhrbacteria bacterium]|nr:zinc-ribbon domain containing protein [Candidatus Uhrbacteria bacterium]
MNTCTQCKKEFTVTDQDSLFYEKMGVPHPVLCADCRRQHLLIWRNQRTLYSRKCSATNKPIISIFSPDSPYIVYDRDYWWSAAWDPFEHGMDFDFSKTFAEQFNELLRITPLAAIFNGNSENSLYCNHVGSMKNSYLTFASWGDENVMYSDLSFGDKDSVDMLETGDCQQCYELVQSNNCFDSKYCIQSERCNNSWFLFDCKDCDNCIGCTNLRHKQYYIFNKPYTPEEYKKRAAELRLDTRSGIEKTKREFEEFKKSAIHKYANIITCESCTGDTLTGGQNVRYSFALRDELTDVAYCINGGRNLIDVYDGYGVGFGLERGYLCLDTGANGADNIACFVVWGCQYAYYSYNCHSSFEIFGCTGVRNKKHCILNRQYTQSEYEQLKKKIIAHMREAGEWGHLPSPSISPFGYNETLAHEYTPLTKEQAISLGFKWQDAMPGTTGRETLVEVSEIITDVPDLIVNEVFACRACKRNYRIVTAELAFYRSKELPLPTQCPQCRYDARRSLRNPHTLWNRQCMCELENHSHAGRCPVQFETTYAPDRPEKVYCETCYQSEII